MIQWVETRVYLCLSLIFGQSVKNLRLASKMQVSCISHDTAKKPLKTLTILEVSFIETYLYVHVRTLINEAKRNR